MLVFILIGGKSVEIKESRVLAEHVKKQKEELDNLSKEKKDGTLHNH